MITFAIGLLIGSFFGIIFTSILVMSRDEPEYFNKKNISLRQRSEVSLGKEYLVG
jgi:hypothetical protein